MNAQLAAGATAVSNLIESLARQSDADFTAAPLEEVETGADVRNYASIADLVEASVRANVVEASPLHRQAFLRCLGRVLTFYAEDAAGTKPLDMLRFIDAALPAALGGERPIAQ